jgi:hypothetical protein
MLAIASECIRQHLSAKGNSVRFWRLKYIAVIPSVLASMEMKARVQWNETDGMLPGMRV